MSDDKKLSMDSLLETAMGLSMGAQFLQAMQTAGRNLQQTLDPTAAEPPRYIYAMIDGRRQGPFSLGEVAERVERGVIDKRTYLWKPGMQDWKRAGEVADLAPGVAVPPVRIPEL